MKFSSFNYIVNQENSYILIYNTLRGNVVRIKKENYSLDNQELIKHKFVVPDNQNESNIYKYAYLKKIFDEKSLNLSIATTLNCNLRCPYCFEEGNKSHEILTEDITNAICKYILSKRKRQISITWFGGEPLLNFNSITNISEFLLRNKIDFSSGIITNGTLLTEKMISKFDEYRINTAQITFDGTKELHDKKRFFKNGKGTFDLILSNINKIIEGSQTRIHLKTNIDRINIDSYNELKEQLSQIFYQEIKSKRLLLTENYVRNKTNFNGCENCLSKIEYFDFLHKRNNYPITIPTIKGPCPLRNNSSFAIGPDGSIYKCLEHLGNKDLAIGNILNFSISVLKHASYALNDLPFDDVICSQCNILPICGGGCPNERKLLHSDDRPCPIEKLCLHEILTSLYQKNV